MGKLDGRKVVIIHGWSDNYESMSKVGDPLKAEGANVFYANYDSREDRAVYEDFAEGLDQELTRMNLTTDSSPPVHFVTHSTGALVLRQWFRQYEERQEKVGNVVFLAPANFGSPLAVMGKTLMGKIFKGQHKKEDRFEIGKNILHGLELASPFSWHLAEYDLFGEAGSRYHEDGIRAFVITGHAPYGGLRRFASKPGTDGTITVAGASLNSRKLVLDFTNELHPTSLWYGFKADETPVERKIAPDLPFAIHRELNHASILELKDNNALRESVVRCLQATPADYDGIRSDFRQFSEAQVGDDAEKNYQQFLFRMLDDRGQPVSDYHLEFNVRKAEKLQEIYPGGPNHVPVSMNMEDSEEELSGELDELLEENEHTHSQDPSFKRFLLNKDQVSKWVKPGYVLTMRIEAHTGDNDIEYCTDILGHVLLYDPNAKVEVEPFHPNTTTLIEIHINRNSRLLELLP